MATTKKSAKMSFVQRLKENGWGEDMIALLASGILTYKEWYKRSWKFELLNDMMRSYYEPFGFDKPESGVLQSFRNKFGGDLRMITKKDLQELEQYLQ